MKNKSLGLLLGAVAGLMLIPPVFSVPAPVRMEQSYSNGGGVGSTPLAKPEAAIQVRLDQAYGKLPLSFEANQGQTDGRVKFLARTGGSTLFLTSTEAVLVLTKSEARAKRDRFRGPTPDLTQRQKTSRTVVRMTLVGANPQPQVAGLEEFPGNVNYFIGNDPTKWRTNVPTYAKVEYRDVYPGVNLVYYGNQRKLEYDFVVAPGADPGAIRLAFEGVDNLTLDTQGNLILHTVGGEIRQQVPIVYQESNGARREISGRYVLQGKDGVGFQVAAYDRTKPLVIDPVLVYSTYLGGSGFDGGLGIALDASGNAYVTGEISSIDFPTANPIQATFGGGSNDAFMAKLNAAGSALVYSTYLGGSGDDVTTGIAVDGAGNAYVTGITSSTDFPTVNPLQAAFGGGVFDGFVAKFNATGTALVYSTYLGGSGGSGDAALGIAVDAAGNAYVTGFTSSTDFPTVNPLQATFGGGNHDAFVAKFNATGTALVYSTYLGGSSAAFTAGDAGLGIAVDGAGNAYVTGRTPSADFPTVNPLQATFGGGDADAFMAKLNAAGSALVYSTYLGGTGGDAALDIAVDAAGNAYVTGETSSIDFPTANPVQATFGGGGRDAFVAKLNAAGSALVYSTYLGGSGFEQVFGGIAVDAAGNAYVTGSTTSADFPTANPIQATLTGVEDAFVAKLNAAGLALVYSTYLGGSGFNEPVGIAVDGAGNAYVTGITSSTDFPTVNPLQATFGGGDHDAFVAKLNPSIPSVNTPSGSNVAVPLGSGVAVTFPSVSSQGNTTVTTSSTGPTPPAGFSLGMPPTYYDITTTGAFTAPVNVCIRYDPEQFSDPENPQNLRLLHFEGSAWVDVTTSNDTVNFRICGQVSSFSPFVIAESPVMGVSIDIKPGSFPNTINLGSGGTVPVAIFSTASFDARTVDPLTVTLASAPVKLKGKGTPMASFEDVNGDGLLDLVVHVETTALQLSASDTVAVLEGQTTGGTMIRGNDSVRVVP